MLLVGTEAESGKTDSPDDSVSNQDWVVAVLFQALPLLLCFGFALLAFGGSTLLALVSLGGCHIAEFARFVGGLGFETVSLSLSLYFCVAEGGINGLNVRGVYVNEGSRALVVTDWSWLRWSTTRGARISNGSFESYAVDDMEKIRMQSRFWKMGRCMSKVGRQALLLQG